METRRDYEAKVKASLLASERWQRCGGCDHVLVIARSLAELEPTPKRPRRGQFSVMDPFWANCARTARK